MSGVRSAEAGRWQDALTAAALAFVDPLGCGAIAVRARAGVVRDRFFSEIEKLAGGRNRLFKVPAGITDDRLIGGLDLSQSLAAGKPILEPGLLARADGGMLVVASAERLSSATAARIAAVLDRGIVSIERDGMRREIASNFGLLLLDESSEPDEGPPPAVMDRVAFVVDLEGIALSDLSEPSITPEAVSAARALPHCVEADQNAVEALVETADALGIGSMRTTAFAVRTACAAAALAGRLVPSADDLAMAARLALGPRATRRPELSAQADDDDEDQEKDDGDDDPSRDQPSSPPDSEHEAPAPEQTRGVDAASMEILLAAAAAALPPGLLREYGGRARTGSRSAGRSGRATRSRNRGARLASRPGQLGGGARLDVLATLRAAAPFQPLRTKERADGRLGKGRLSILPADIRIARYKQRNETSTLFVVDASGSSALNRLAEAKGAVELLLADCYARRDWVGLIAFRGKTSSLLLPPTRSLTRAKRCLEELSGGGGTPLAAGLKAALEQARSADRAGRTATIVVLTDGRANVGLDGTGGRPQAEADAMNVGRHLAAQGDRILLIDTGPRPNPFARRLTETMAGEYLALPHADSRSVNAAIRRALHSDANLRSSF